MDFILSKFMNRSSPTSQNSEANLSDRTESTNKENDNKIKGDTFEKLNNSNVNYEDHQPNQNIPICVRNVSNNCIKIDDAIDIQNELSGSISNRNNAEYKAMQVLHSVEEAKKITIVSAVINNNNNNNALQFKDSTKINLESLENNEKANERNKIGIMRLNNDIKISDTNSLSNVNDNDLNKISTTSNEIVSTLQQSHIVSDIKENNISIENSNLQEMVIPNPYNLPPNMTIDNEIMELLAQEGLLDEFSIATALQFLNNSNQESIDTAIIPELFNENKVESKSNTINITDNNSIEENLTDNISLEKTIKNSLPIFESNNINHEETQSITNNQMNEMLILPDEIQIATFNSHEIVCTDELDKNLNENNNANLPTINEKASNMLEQNLNNEEIQKSIPASNISLNDILSSNENLKEKNQISAVSSELSELNTSENILNSKTTDDNNIKQENVKQPAGIGLTNDNNKVENSTINSKQPQIKQDQNILNESDENINPFEIRSSGDVSSLFSTPDSISPNETFTETSLPDIINTLPTITVDGIVNNSLNISSLANHFNALHVHVTDEDSNSLNATITKTSGAPSNISSDDELFAECESFPVTANNSTTDINVINGIKTDIPAHLKTTLDLNVTNTVQGLIGNIQVSTNDLPEHHECQTSVGIQLNQSLNKEEDALNTTQNIKNATVIPDNSGENVSSNIDVETTGKNENEEFNGKNNQKILEQKTPEDSLEYLTGDQNIIIENNRENQSPAITIHTMQNNKADLPIESDVGQNVEASVIDFIELENQLNVSAQWSDIVSSVNLNEQENLENSHIDLLNTTPQDLVDQNCGQQNDVEDNITKSFEHSKSTENIPSLDEKPSCSNIKQTGIAVSITEFEEIENATLSKQNEINKMIISNKKIPVNSPNEELHSLGTESVLLSELRDFPEEQNNINKTSVSDIKLPIGPPDIVEVENTTFESNLSSSRNSLNDTEVMNITQNMSQKIQSNYSLDVTMECNDQLSNKVQDISIRDLNPILNQTQDILPLNTTQVLRSSPKSINSILKQTEEIIPLNVTQDLTSSSKPINTELLNTENKINNVTPVLNRKCDLLPQSNDYTAINQHITEIPIMRDQTVIGTSNLSNKLESVNNGKFESIEINNINNQLNKPETENSILANFTKVENIPTSNDDFEPMDVDVSISDGIQQQFVKLNDTIDNSKILPFNEPPSRFGMSSSKDEFKSIGNDNIDMIFQSCDFEYLSKRGNNIVKDTRKDSLLLKFDPLLGRPVPVTTNLQNHFTIREEEDVITPNTLTNDNKIGKQKHEIDNNLFINLPTGIVENQNKIANKRQKAPIKLKINKKDIVKSTTSSSLDSPLLEEFEKLERKLEFEEKGVVNNKMSVDVISNNIKIENDVQSNENINSNKNSNEKHDLKMEDLEKKIKNEVLKTEDVEKKLKDAEQREEALLKRITDKDKTIAKMGGVIEAYEKAIAELIAEKEQITQNYEKQMEEIQSERDLNKQHLESLESTFTDLHVKYERSKQLLAKLKASEEELQAEKKRNLENLGLQEQRYEKMKNHAMQQLEIANNKLEHLTKNHQLEITKLKALLKKEEIAKSSINEQLIQKSKENEELVKICEELINGGSTS